MAFLLGGQLLTLSEREGRWDVQRHVFHTIPDLIRGGMHGVVIHATGTLEMVRGKRSWTRYFPHYVVDMAFGAHGALIMIDGGVLFFMSRHAEGNITPISEHKARFIWSMGEELFFLSEEGNICMVLYSGLVIPIRNLTVLIPMRFHRTEPDGNSVPAGCSTIGTMVDLPPGVEVVSRCDVNKYTAVLGSDNLVYMHYTHTWRLIDDEMASIFCACNVLFGVNKDKQYIESLWPVRKVSVSGPITVTSGDPAGKWSVVSGIPKIKHEEGDD